VAPICQSTTYRQRTLGQPPDHTYSRASNPTVATLEEALAALEGAAAATCFVTGMAAITTLVLAAASSRPGAQVVCSTPTYGGTVRLLHGVLGPLGVRARFVDLTDPSRLEEALAGETCLVLVETPANPTLQLVDIAAVADTCRRRVVPLGVDNTFLTPVLQRPLDLGATVSILSTTKYVDGHDATTGGALLTHDGRLHEQIRLVRTTIGSIQSPFAAWLTLRGLTTLPGRIRQQSRSAHRIAQWLAGHPRAPRVHYPGLPDFPQRDLALRQHGPGDDRNGGIVSFQVAGGRDAAQRLVDRLRLFTLAENLGAAESLVTHPVSMTHGDVPIHAREAAGITEGLLRLSVGLEHADDLLADLAHALETA
jgi:cystathionine beta-lyase/cystathionine gamma-synthase